MIGEISLKIICNRKEEIIMRISGINSQINYYQQKNKVSNKQLVNIKGNIKNSKVKDDRVANPAIWDELSKKYNITNASFNEISTISRKLYDAKQISLGDHGSFTLIPQIKARLKARFNQNKNPFLTSNKQNWKEEKINWKEEFEAQIERDRKNGNILGYNHNKKLLGFLEKIMKN
jgi:hypothetical protein